MAVIPMPSSLVAESRAASTSALNRQSRSCHPSIRDNASATHATGAARRKAHRDFATRAALNDTGQHSDGKLKGDAAIVAYEPACRIEESLCGQSKCLCTNRLKGSGRYRKAEIDHVFHASRPCQSKRHDQCNGTNLAQTELVVAPGGVEELLCGWRPGDVQRRIGQVQQSNLELTNTQTVQIGHGGCLPPTKLTDTPR